MSELNDLYQETILEHNKNPRNFRAIEDADKEADGNNPLCGDALRVYVKMDGEKVAKFGQDSPMKRPAQPVELASAYVMLAEPMSSYVSGATIAVTGGQPMI